MRSALAAFNGETVSNRGTKSETEQLCDDFCDHYGYKDSQTRAALHHRIQICGAAHGLDCIRRMIGEIQEDHRVEEPIKVLHTKLNHAIIIARSAT